MLNASLARNGQCILLFSLYKYQNSCNTKQQHRQDSEGVRVVVQHAAYRILRQLRPSLRKWTASSSGWPSPRPRRRLPPAAAPLETTAAPRDRGQHSAAASNNRACGKTLRNNDATLQGGSSASASLRTAPERDARCVKTPRQRRAELPEGCDWLGALSITLWSLSIS